MQAGDTISLDFATHGCRSLPGRGGRLRLSRPASAAPPPSCGSASAACAVTSCTGAIELPCACGRAAQTLLSPCRRSSQPRYHEHDHRARHPRLPAALRSAACSSAASSATATRCPIAVTAWATGWRARPSSATSRAFCRRVYVSGAVQVPADGQPIVLLNDRQTIGGYPKIGSALSLDTARLAQLTPGATVHFAPISPHGAHNALHLARSFSQRQPLLGAPTMTERLELSIAIEELLVARNPRAHASGRAALEPVITCGPRRYAAATFVAMSLSAPAFR